MSRGRILGAFVIAGALLTAGCANNSPGDLSKSAAKVLRPAVEDVRQTAANGTLAQLRRSVQSLKDLVRQQERAGQVSSQRAVAILNAADVLMQDARTSLSPSPSPSESPTPVVTSLSPPPTPTPTPTSASPTPSQTTSPSPTGSPSAQVSVSTGPAFHGRPRSSPSSSSRPNSAA